MSIYDAILVNVYRTRLYAPLLLIMVLYLCTPRIRNAVDETILKVENVKNVWVISALIVLTFGCGILFCYSGKSWGGDWSQYLAQTRAILTDTIDEWYQEHSFIINVSDEGIGCDVYPWIWPLLCCPIYRIFQSNFMAYKIYGAFWYALCMIPLFFILKRRFSKHVTCLICLLLALNLNYLISINTLCSDIVYTFCVLCTVNVIDKYYGEQVKQTKKIFWGMLAGFLVFITNETRTMGIVMLMALGVTDVISIIIERKVFSFKNLMRLCPYITYFLASKLFYLFLPKGGATYYDYFSIDINSFFLGIRKYWDILAEVIGANCRPIISTISHIGVLIIVLLAFVGALTNLKKELFLAAYSAGTALMLTIYNYKDSRFLYGIFPFFLMFAYHGVFYIVNNILPRLGTKMANCVKNLSKSVLLAYFCSLIVAVTVVSYNIQVGTYNLREVDSQNATEVYEYIKNNLEKDDVIYFFKPRVLYYFTGNLSYFWFHDEINHLDKADYVLQLAGHEESDVDMYSEENGYLIYSNEQFKLFSIR